MKSSTIGYIIHWICIVYPGCCFRVQKCVQPDNKLGTLYIPTCNYSIFNQIQYKCTTVKQEQTPCTEYLIFEYILYNSNLYFVTCYTKLFSF